MRGRGLLHGNLLAIVAELGDLAHFDCSSNLGDRKVCRGNIQPSSGLVVDLDKYMPFKAQEWVEFKLSAARERVNGEQQPG